MAFLSLKTLAGDAAASLKRFPFTLIHAFLGTTVAIFLTECNGPDCDQSLRYLMAASLGVPLTFAAQCFTEKRGTNRRAAFLFHLLAFLLPLAYAALLPAADDMTEAHVLRHFVLVAGAHFLSAYAPFLTGREINGFWQFNKALFLRFLLGILYSSVLYVGLAAALAAVENLFGVNISAKIYTELWIVISGLFQTWFFLAGVPRDLNALESDRTYPKGLRVFGQYALLPLTAIYLAILYAYGVKILLAMDWPKGWVGWLVSTFSSVGILTMLLLHPYREFAESRWVNRAITLFYAAALPLTGLLFGSAFRRISDYGVTEERYYLLVLTFWLAAISLYFVFSRVRDIRWIPITLSVIAFLSTFGPWGATGVSIASQISRLRDYLGTTEGQANAREISSILDYFHDVHGLEAAEERLGRELGKTPSDAAAALGVTYNPAWRYGQTGRYFSYWQDGQENMAFDVRGFAVLKKFTFASYARNHTPIAIGKTDFTLAIDWNTPALIVEQTGRDGKAPVQKRFPLASVIADTIALKRPTEGFRWQEDFPMGRIQIIVQSLEGQRTEQQAELTMIRGTILIGAADAE